MDYLQHLWKLCFKAVVVLVVYAFIVTVKAGLLLGFAAGEATGAAEGH